MVDENEQNTSYSSISDFEKRYFPKMYQKKSYMGLSNQSENSKNELMKILSTIMKDKKQLY